jgi:hypothetical protein
MLPQTGESARAVQGCKGLGDLEAGFVNRPLQLTQLGHCRPAVTYGSFQFFGQHF